MAWEMRSSRAPWASSLRSSHGPPASSLCRGPKRRARGAGARRRRSTVRRWAAPPRARGAAVPPLTRDLSGLWPDPPGRARGSRVRKSTGEAADRAACKPIRANEVYSGRAAAEQGIVRTALPWRRAGNDGYRL